MRPTRVSSEEVPNGNELLTFHGCAPEAMDVGNPDSIVQTGFLKKYWKSSAGDWQRFFGPGFYFGLQASKAHERPAAPDEGGAGWLPHRSLHGGCGDL